MNIPLFIFSESDRSRSRDQNYSGTPFECAFKSNARVTFDPDIAP